MYKFSYQFWFSGEHWQINKLWNHDVVTALAIIHTAFPTTLITGLTLTIYSRYFILPLALLVDSRRLFSSMNCQVKPSSNFLLVSPLLYLSLRMLSHTGHSGWKAFSTSHQGNSSESLSSLHPETGGWHAHTLQVPVQHGNAVPMLSPTQLPTIEREVIDPEVVDYGGQLEISKQEKDRDYLKEACWKVAVIWNCIKC